MASRSPQDRRAPSARKAAQRGEDIDEDGGAVVGTIVPGSGRVRTIGEKRSVETFAMRFANDPDDGPVYHCTPPKTAPFLKMFQESAHLPENEAAAMVADTTEEWIRAAFDEDDADEILDRMLDPRDRGIDSADVNALMKAVQEASTGDPTSSRRRSSRSR